MRTRFVIVNADDFGLTSDINRGIIEAHERGIVTSASLMVRYLAAAAAAAYACARPQLSVGLHFDLAEWRYRNQAWEISYEVADAKDPVAIARELERQLNRFRLLMQREPTHLDSHQHAHLSEPCRGILSEQAQRLDIPLRGCSPEISYEGGFYGQTAEGGSYPDGISPATLRSLLAELKPGWTELGCHPGYGAGLKSDYLLEREEEIRVLSTAEIRRTLHEENVRLCSFQDYLEIQKKEPRTGAP